MTEGGSRSVDLSRIAKIHVALLAAATGLCLATRWADPVSLVLGGLVMALNVRLLRLVTQAMVSGGDSPQGSGRVALAAGGFVLHFGLFLGMAAALFWRVPVEAMSFAAGVTLLLVACVIEAVRAGRAGAKGVS